MELAEIFTKIKKDVMSTVTLTHPEKLKVVHILKSSFKYCVAVENREYGYSAETVHTDQKDAFKSIFGEIFSK